MSDHQKLPHDAGDDAGLPGPELRGTGARQASSAPAGCIIDDGRYTVRIGLNTIEQEVGEPVDELFARVAATCHAGGFVEGQASRGPILSEHFTNQHRRTVESIIDRVMAGDSVTEVADDFNYSPFTVRMFLAAAASREADESELVVAAREAAEYWGSDSFRAPVFAGKMRRMLAALQASPAPNTVSGTVPALNSESAEGTEKASDEPNGAIVASRPTGGGAETPKSPPSGGEPTCDSAPEGEAVKLRELLHEAITMLRRCAAFLSTQEVGR